MNFDLDEVDVQCKFLNKQNIFELDSDLVLLLFKCYAFTSSCIKVIKFGVLAYQYCISIC